MCAPLAAASYHLPFLPHAQGHRPLNLFWPMFEIAAPNLIDIYRCSTPVLCIPSCFSAPAIHKPLWHGSPFVCRLVCLLLIHHAEGILFERGPAIGRAATLFFSFLFLRPPNLVGRPATDFMQFACFFLHEATEPSLTS